MDIGIFSVQPDANQDPAFVARRAEELGFASYWAPDHIMVPVHYSDPYPGNPGDGPDPDYLWKMPDPIVALTRAATATERIGLGTGVLLVPERNPIHLANEIASLDQYSGGRFLFGIGAGWNKEESEILGGDFPHRWTQVEDAIGAMKACWTEEESEYHGKYYDFPPLRCYPKPASRPHPPILLPSIMFGGKWAKRVFHRIVRYGDGWIPAIQSVEQLVDGRTQIESIAREAGRDPASLRIIVLGGPGQWRSRDEVSQLEAAGAEQVVLWIDPMDRSATERELEGLARELL